MTRPAALKAVAIAVVVTVLVVAQRFGVLSHFANPAAVKRTFTGLGLWGELAFVVAYTILQPFGVPGTVFVVGAPLIWPWPVAFGLSMTGTMAASVVGFSFARFVGRDWVKERIPKRLAPYEAALEKRGFSTVALLRFIFWMPQWLHVFLGVSRVSFATHFWGSLVGYAPPILFVSYFGARLFDALRAAPRSLWIAAAAATLGLVLAWLAYRRRSAGRE